MPDYVVRVREVWNYTTIVRADSYEDGLNTVHYKIEQSEDDDQIREELCLREGEGGFETDGAEEVNDGHDPDMHQHELTCDPELDTASSASRQHWIETGLYLTHDEVKEFAT